MKENFTFTRVKTVTKPVILNWFELEHVQEFYHGEGLKNTLHSLELYCQGINNNGQYTFDHWIAFYDVIH